MDLGHTACDINEVIGMVETRMKMVNALIGNCCSWREDITVLKDILVRASRDRDEQRESGLAGAIAKLKEAGINIIMTRS